jgi:hypothetical protein
MKVIVNETISAVTASSEDAEYPVSNVLNRHPKKAWKAAPTVNSAFLNVSISGGITDLGIVGTNAKTVRAAAPEVLPMTWANGDDEMSFENPSGAIIWEGSEMIITALKLVDADTGDMWIELDQMADEEEFTLLLEADEGETLTVGVVSGGHALVLPDPDYGITEGLIDHSIEKETANGGYYYRKRNIVRKYGLKIDADRNTEAIDLMRKIGMALGQKSLMWRLTNLNHSQWVVYGRVKVSQTHNTWQKNNVKIELTEAV